MFRRSALNFAYIIALLFLCALYVAGIFLMKFIRRPGLFNFLFVALVFIPYVFLCLIVYNDVGFYDWNFRNTLPTANVSPFMFSLVLFLFIFPFV